MTIYAWIDYGYYDGNLYFSRLYVKIAPPVKSATVRWLGSEWVAALDEKLNGAKPDRA